MLYIYIMYYHHSHQLHECQCYYFFHSQHRQRFVKSPGSATAFSTKIKHTDIIEINKNNKKKKNINNNVMMIIIMIIIVTIIITTTISILSQVIIDL